MPNSVGKLHQIEPREQVGPQTGKLYEYQYHQAAAGALMLLDASENAACMSTANGMMTMLRSLNYRVSFIHFYQVKTKSDGPWPIGEFFGLGKLNTKTGQRPLSARKSSIFSNMWDRASKSSEINAKHLFSYRTAKSIPSCKRSWTNARPPTLRRRLIHRLWRFAFDSILPFLLNEKELTAASRCSISSEGLRTQLGLGTKKSLDDAKVPLNRR